MDRNLRIDSNLHSVLTDNERPFKSGISFKAAKGKERYC